jgi:hypothetical protein
MMRSIYLKEIKFIIFMLSLMLFLNLVFVNMTIKKNSINPKIISKQNDSFVSYKFLMIDLA